MGTWIVMTSGFRIMKLELCDPPVYEVNLMELNFDMEKIL